MSDTAEHTTDLRTYWALVGVLAMLAAGLLRRYGLLVAIGLHFWADVLWHVAWGALQ